MMKEYTIKEAADLLDLSTSTIRRRIKSNKIKAKKKETKFGPQYFIPSQEINKATIEEKVIEAKEVNQPVPVEEFKNSIIRAVQDNNAELLDKKIEGFKEGLERSIERQNRRLMEEVTANMENIIEQQNQAIKDLQEKVEKVEEESSKNPIVKFLEWLYY